ncbi:MAG: argininosuccinate lyase, partial [Actinomycetota bacterium]
RTAYHVVGDTVRRASRDGLRGVDITAGMLDDAAKERLGHGLGLSDDGLAEVLDPEAIVRSRTVDGGAAPDTVRGMADRCARAADRIAEQARQAAGSYDRAENALVGAAERVSRG